jgi:hypothetical protein
MISLTELTAILATVVCLWGVYGLLPHLHRPDRRAAFWLAFTFIAALLEGAVRASYWDVLSVAVGTRRAEAWREVLGGTEVNWIANALLLAAGLGLLRLLHLLIPEEDRGSYSMMSAPLYPKRPPLGLLVLYLRELWLERRNRR